jgi:hypothetical protein
MAALRAIFLLLYFSSITVAGVQVSFPLQGWHRPGQYVPVCLKTDGMVGDFTLSAPGAVDTTIHLDGGQRTLVVPWLILQANRQLPASTDVFWRGVFPDQRLVGVVGSIPADLQPLFPNQQIIPLPLDESVALDGEAVCWQTLDAVVMDAGWYGRIGKSKVESLLDVGLMLVVIAPSDAVFGSEFQLRDGLWIARRSIAGPRGVVLGEEAYLPTYGWKADWPVSIRRQLFTWAAVLSLVMLAIGRLGWRWNWLVPSLLALAVTGGLTIFAWRHPPIYSMRAELLIGDSTLTQHDTWSYQTSRQTNIGGLRWIGPTWPALFNFNQISQTNLALRCGPDGLPLAFTYTLSPNSTLAFCTRRFSSVEPVATARFVQSPTLELARRLYPTLIPTGQRSPSDADDPPALILRPR